MAKRDDRDAFPVALGLSVLFGCLMVVAGAVLSSLFYVLGGLALAGLAGWTLLRTESADR